MRAEQGRGAAHARGGGRAPWPGSGNDAAGQHLRGFLPSGEQRRRRGSPRGSPALLHPRSAQWRAETSVCPSIRPSVRPLELGGALAPELPQRVALWGWGRGGQRWPRPRCPVRGAEEAGVRGAGIRRQVRAVLRWFLPGGAQCVEPTAGEPDHVSLLGWREMTSQGINRTLFK